MRNSMLSVYAAGLLTLSVAAAPVSALPMPPAAVSVPHHRTEVQTAASRLMGYPYYRGCIQTLVSRAQGGLQGRHDPHFIIDFASRMCIEFMLN